MVSDLPLKGLSNSKYMIGQFNLFKPYVLEEYKAMWLMENGSLSW